MPQPKPQKSTPPKVDRPPIVLIHGFRGAPIGLQAIADPLITAGYKVYTPAIPPFAGATLNGEYTPRNYAHFLADYITSHNLERPILIGHSMGSTIAAATAHYYPKLINHQLVLLSPISAHTPISVNAVSPLAALTPTKIVDHVTTRFLFASPDKSLYRPTLEITHQCTQDRPKTSDLLAATAFSTRYAVSDFQLSQDILMLAGAHDRIVTAEQTRQLADKLHAKLYFIPNSGHLHNYEAPVETARFILEFLDRPAAN